MADTFQFFIHLREKKHQCVDRQIKKSKKINYDEIGCSLKDMMFFAHTPGPNGIVKTETIAAIVKSSKRAIVLWISNFTLNWFWSLNIDEKTHNFAIVNTAYSQTSLIATKLNQLVAFFCLCWSKLNAHNNTHKHPTNVEIDNKLKNLKLENVWNQTHSIDYRV